MGQGGGELLTQLLMPNLPKPQSWWRSVHPGSNVGFAIYKPTQVDRSMTPLADTSASGDHNKIIIILGSNRHAVCSFRIKHVFVPQCTVGIHELLSSPHLSILIQFSHLLDSSCFAYSQADGNTCHKSVCQNTI